MNVIAAIDGGLMVIPAIMSTYRSVNPADGRLIEEYPQHSPAEIEQRLAAADRLVRSPAWRDDLAARLRILERLGALLEAEAEDIAALVTSEMGKPKREAVGEVKLCAKIAQYYVANAERMLAPISYPTKIGEAWVEHHPLGVLLAIEPWNFPIYQVIRVLAPAIAVGNPVLLKHAPSTPGCGIRMEELMKKAGAPEGALTNVFLGNDQVSELLGDPRIQGVALTGSERAGAAVGARATQMLKKATLELGGNDVFVVLDDADVAKAAAVGAAARLFNAGQACTGAKRFVVQRAVSEKFLELVRDAMTSARIGDPTDPQTTLGPLSSAAARETLEGQLKSATENGATMLFGGKRVDRPGFFFEPGLLVGMTPDNPMYAAEFFGPVGQLFIVDTDDDVVALANDSPFGLGGAIFSRDIARARRLASRIDTGMMHINMSAVTRPELPFGGVKRSGFGRELGDLGLMEFVNKKLVIVAG